jgi:hypothetical protein
MRQKISSHAMLLMITIFCIESLPELPPPSTPELGPSASSVAEDELEGEGGDQLIRGQDIVSFSQWAEKQADQAGAPAKETEKKPNDSPQV